MFLSRRYIINAFSAVQRNTHFDTQCNEYIQPSLCAVILSQIQIISCIGPLVGAVKGPLSPLTFRQIRLLFMECSLGHSLSATVNLQ